MVSCRSEGGRIKSLVESTDGYLQVKLSKDAKQKTIGVHILVAKAFVSGGGDGLEVNHIDCNRKNNNYQNLEWVSHIDNIRHAVKCGTHITKIRSMSGKNNPNFGNKALSAKYAADRALSNEKQSRPGAQNGRAVAVRAMFDEETYIDFGYMRECADFLIENGYSKSKNADNIISYISKSAKSGTPYHKIKFTFI